MYTISWVGGGGRQCVLGFSTGSLSQAAPARILAMPHASCVALGKFSHLSVPQRSCSPGMLQ